MKPEDQAGRRLPRQKDGAPDCPRVGRASGVPMRVAKQLWARSTPLTRFLSAFGCCTETSRPGEVRGFTRPRGRLWPAPVPYGGIAHHPDGRCSPHLKRRRRRWRGKQLGANLYFGLCSFLAFGSPAVPVPVATQGVALSEAQGAALERYEQAYDRLARVGVTPLTGGRKPLAARLAKLHLTKYGDSTTKMSERPIDIQAEEFDFPATAATVPLMKLNHGAYLEALENPETIVRDAPPLGRVPVPYLPRPLHEWLAYLRKVDAAQGLEVLGEEEVARDSEGHALVGGFFGVEKSNANGIRRCRGIMDRRPQNSLEATLPTPVLPHGAMLCSIILRPHERLRVSCRDLENFFCTLGLPYAKVCRNAVGTPLTADQLLEAGVSVPPHLLGRERVYVALRSLAMGDVNALGHAQQAHEVMLEAGGATSPDQLMRYGRPLPRGQCQVGGYVDDLSVVQIHGHDVDPDTGRELIARAEAGYASAGATVKKSKNIDQASRAIVWGTEIDGVEGWASVPLAKLIQLQWLTLEWLGGRRTDYITFAAV